MIKINLLPVKRKKPKPVPAFLVVSVLLLTASLIGSYYASNFYFREKLNAFETQKAQNQTRLKELDEKLNEVKDFESLNKTFTERKDIIEQLTRNQSMPVRIIDEMSRRLTDGVWLNSMNIAGAKISISGVGFTNTDIVAFVQSLKGSGLFVDVLLLGTRMGSTEGTDVYMFDIEMRVQA